MPKAKPILLLFAVIQSMYMGGLYVKTVLGMETLHGTTLAALLNEKEIVVAADSRLVRGIDTPDPNPMCKIRQFDNIFVTAFGLYGETTSGFDLWRIVSISAHGSSGVSEKIKHCDTSLRSPLKSALAQIKKLNPVLFEKNFALKPALGVIFFGLEDNTLKLKYLQFDASSSTDASLSLNVKSLECPGMICPDRKFGFLLVGADSQSEAETFVKSHRVEVGKGNLADVARKFVQMTIDKNSVAYGPPIDVISVSKDGAKWIQTKDEGLEIKK